MDEKRLEREYRKWKRQTSPDLWERIDKNLKSHPERDAAAEEEKTENGSLAAYVTIPFSRGYMLFTAAAIILFFVVVWRNPQHPSCNRHFLIQNSYPYHLHHL